LHDLSVLHVVMIVYILHLLSANKHGWNIDYYRFERVSAVQAYAKSKSDVGGHKRYRPAIPKVRY